MKNLMRCIAFNQHTRRKHNMTTPVEMFIASLQAIEACCDITCVETVEHKLIDNAKYWADIALINDSGNCDMIAAKEVMKAGFYIYPGEQDRFGWVTGCIETSKGVIVFG